MLSNSYIGWSGLVLFAGAGAGALALALYPFLARYATLDAQVAVLGIGVLALVASVLGFCAFRTTQGKVAGIGGLLLLLAVVLLLSWTTITVVRSGAL